MKKKMLLVLLAVAVSVSMIAAATYAWFTDDATAGDAIFTAGTVDVEVDSPEEFTVEENWNPGDETDVKWTIKNTGSKAIVFKIEPEAKWYPSEENSGEKLNLKNITIKFKIGDKYIDPRSPENGNVYPWKVVGSGDNINGYTIYYIGDPIPAGEKIDLDLQVVLDGPGTGNKYQGARFELGGKVSAVQASNGAPNSQWNVDYYDYLQAKELSINYYMKTNLSQNHYGLYLDTEVAGKARISLKDTTTENGFYVGTNGRLMFNDGYYFNYFDGINNPLYAQVPVVINKTLIENDLGEIKRIEVLGKIVEAPIDVKKDSIDYSHVNIPVAANDANPASTATIDNWSRTPEATTYILVYLKNGDVYKIEVNYTHE